MQVRRYILGIIVLMIAQGTQICAQESYFGHYFIGISSSNPAHAGDTRFAQFQIDERLQPMTNGEIISHTLLSYDQKLLNHRSGIGISLERHAAQMVENNLRLNYSYTMVFNRKSWFRAGLGVSFRSLNTHATEYRYPDQYDNYGFTGLPSQELDLIDSEKDYYIGFSAGLAAYGESMWLTISADNINRPAIQIIGDAYRVPLTLHASVGYLFPINKNKRPRRIFAPNGGIEPYSSIGPILDYQKSGPFHRFTIGVNAFTNPFFWGANLRYHCLFDLTLRRGASSLTLLAGYRVESWSIAYSYDYQISPNATNYLGAHEISLIFYLYTIKADYKKNKLLPFPNQLMY